MSSVSAIVPCGENYEARGRRLVGFVGCIHCEGFMTVRPDKAGRLQAFCDRLLTVEACGAQLEWPRGVTMPAYTAADLEQFRDDIAALPSEYREHLARSWRLSTDQLVSMINGTNEPKNAPQNSGETAGQAGPERPVQPAGQSGSAGTGEPANSAGKSRAGGSTTRVGTDGTMDGGPAAAGTGESADTRKRAEQPGRFLAWD